MPRNLGFVSTHPVGVRTCLTAHWLADIARVIPGSAAKPQMSEVGTSLKRFQLIFGSWDGTVTWVGNVTLRREGSVERMGHLMRPLTEENSKICPTR